MTSTVFFVRHGLHDRLEHVLCERTPGVSLGEAGRAEAARLAERLKREGLAAVYSSPLERARETAEPIAAAAGVAPRIADDLNELDYGEWSGRSFEDLRGDPVWAAWNADRAHRRPPSGETLLELQGRMARWLDRVRERHPGGRVAVVSHGEPIEAALLWVLGAPLDALARFEVGRHRSAWSWRESGASRCTASTRRSDDGVFSGGDPRPGRRVGSVVP